ncbi:hypothetical protein ACIBEJ_33290 [Nonomuraea sp. NPDC050790]|uniref:hypothetical protein n=1 Tax=Nonomuraea sp. NPDC050790 TaxID=3364371 RepID=UPI0037AA67DE
MPSTERLQKRLGTVFLPQAEQVRPSPGMPQGVDPHQFIDPAGPFPNWRFCYTNLRQGCYTLVFAPDDASGTKYRGTVRIERIDNDIRFSGDLYAFRQATDADLTDPATIPVYPRADYRAYLRGIQANLLYIVPAKAPCRFSLVFEQYDYNQPATGFNGSFTATPSRTLRFDLHTTTTGDLFTGTAFDGSTPIGSVRIRWISASYRRAQVYVNTLQGTNPPPLDVNGETFGDTFAKLGWELRVSDEGDIPLPPALAGIDIRDAWSYADLHELMKSAPTYDPAELDREWRVHLLSIPARLGCGRGVMFDSSIGADPNGISREGSATFSEDGYPPGDCPDGQGGSHYDLAAGRQQRAVPLAFHRSATHEIGHAFNQIHTFFEAPVDNSIMSPTPSVATVIGLAGKFPDEIRLEFSPTATKHLRHLPDPAVRPGAMDFFGSAISAPEPADTTWPEELELTVTPAKDRLALGEPVTLTWTLTNRGQAPVLAPTSLDTQSMIARVSVTDPLDRITFLRPADIVACPSTRFELLRPGDERSGSATVFWGTDGFVFRMPGHHTVEVIVIWRTEEMTAVSGTTDVFIAYPTGAADNDVARLLLDPSVGRAVALGLPYGAAPARIAQAQEVDADHPANVAVREMGLGG